MSLLVALYAIKVISSVWIYAYCLTGVRQLTAQSATDSRYTYGWHRAEILAALVNGVFLLALCFSISIEAIQRLFSVPGTLAFQ
jgi:zinc transporter 1